MKKEKYVLTAKDRSETGSGFCRRHRKQGLVPAVMYCRGKENVNFFVDVKEIQTAVRADAKLIDLKKPNGDLSKALIKEIQEDFLKGVVIHVDFQEVRMDEAIRSTVLVHALAGSVPVGLAAGGILEQPTHELEIECLPGDLPELIEVDISALGIDQSIQVKDLILPKGVKAVSDAHSVVFHVALQAAEVEAAKTAEATAEAAPAADAKAGDAKGEAKPDAKADKKK